MENKFRGLIVNSLNDASVIFYGVPFDKNASINQGSRYAPDKIRELSYFLPPYTSDGKKMDKVKIFDAGNFIDKDYMLLFKKADELFFKDKFKFIVGGDHSITIPFQKVFIEKCHMNHKEPVIIHIDAHCDISSNYLANKYSHASTVRHALNNGLKEENLFMVGIREFEDEGYETLINRKHDIHLFKSHEILKSGLNRLKEELKTKSNKNKYTIYISFDIDSLDASYAPGTGTPETLGLTPCLIYDLFIYLSDFNNIECLDMVEIAPPLDVNDITSWCGIKLCYDFLGYYIK